ncbi:MAG: GNAT family N-acetyltransferase, partial [Marinomonas sp.]
MSQHALHPLLAPKSIVVLTGNDANDPLMLALLKSLAHTDKSNRQKSCPVSLVGAEPAASFSFPLFTSLDEFIVSNGAKPSPDLAVLVGTHSNSSMEDIIAACGEAGIGSLLMLSWTGEPEAKLIPILRKHNVRLLGPNSFGI